MWKPLVRHPELTAYIALLRAVNVGGTGKLPMSDLKTMCEDAGFTKVRTYIASGNVVFESSLTEAQVAAALDRKLKDYAGKPVGVAIRTAAEMSTVLESNPFPDAQSNYTVAIFLDKPPPKDALESMVAPWGQGFAYGDAPGLVECCLVPQLYAARRFGVGLEAWPRLVEIDARCAMLSAFAAAHPAAQADADQA